MRFGYFVVLIAGEITDHARVTVEFKKGELEFEVKAAKKQDTASDRFIVSANSTTIAFALRTGYALTIGNDRYADEIH